LFKPTAPENMVSVTITSPQLSLKTSFKSGFTKPATSGKGGLGTVVVEQSALEI
jgi:hypothetical protein